MFDREKLDKMHGLIREIARLKDLASEHLKIAQDRNGKREHKIMRDDKEILLTEKVMWDEVFLLGALCDSGKFLTKRYPEVFDAYKKQEQVAVDLKFFCIKKLGVDYTQMSISSYIILTEGMFELLLKEQALKYNLPKYFIYKVKIAINKLRKKDKTEN